MNDKSLNDKFYVAPLESPPSRNPPLREVGVILWLRTNLFRNVTDSLVTLATLALVAWVLYSILSWALLSAQWEIVFLNLRSLHVGLQFPPDAIWRAQVSALIMVFLGTLTVGIYIRVPRTFFAVVGVLMLAVLLVPPLSRGVEKPVYHVFVDADSPARQVNFVADQDQVFTFRLVPLTAPEDFQLSLYNGYIEKDNQQANTSFDLFSAASTRINFTGDLDPSVYDLSIAVMVWDRNGEPVAQSPFTEGSQEDLTFEWRAPASDWYTLTVIRQEDAPGSAGMAWLIVDNLEVFRSTRTSIAERIALYGEEPTLACRLCETSAVRTDARFIGERTVAQWFSLQLSPFLLEITLPFLFTVVFGMVGYVLGVASKRNWLKALRAPATLEKWLARLAGLMFMLYIGLQFFGITGGNRELNTAYTALLMVFSMVVIAYAMTQLFKPEGRSRGVALLWAISFPIVLTLINGMAGIDNLTPIPGDRQGGVLLTLFLSAVAIIASFPIGLLLALGRQSDLPVVSLLCTVFIEVVRGVPLITLLFMGRLILPFFGFGLGDVDLIIRIAVVLTLFTAAYMAEVIRGGLQTISKGQYEAAHALGLNDFWTNYHIVIPQALRAVIPAIMGQAVSLFKDTSLVYIIGLFELVGTMNQILGDSQTGYLAFPREGYLFVGLVYFVFSYMMAEASRRIERTGAGAVRRETL